MQSKRSMASAIAIPSKPPAEIYIGGAGDETSRLVLSYAQARQARMAGARQIYYLPHWKIMAAANLVTELAEAGHPMALIGHSWGADTVLRAAQASMAAGFLIGADPVAKPVTRLTSHDGRPAGARLVMHVDAAPHAYDRSDLVKAAGFLAGGGLPRAFRSADLRIETALNHWNFHAMMQAAGSDGRSAEDWLEVFPGEVSQTAG